MKINIKAVIWVILYIILIFTPLILMLVVYDEVSQSVIDSETGATTIYDGETSATPNQDGETSATPNQDGETSATPIQNGIDYFRELSLALGFVGLAMMLLQSLLTSRLKGVHKPFGSDVVYTFHHQISVIALLLVLIHPIVLMIIYDNGIELINIFQVHYSILFGIISLLAVILLVVISIIRKVINFDYTIWRILHGLLALLAGGFALIHIFTSGKYTNSIIMFILWIIYATLWLLLFLYIRLVKPVMMLKNPYKVISVKHNANKVYNLYIKKDKGEILSFDSGQFAWITVRTSPFSFSENPFSISSSPLNKSYIEFAIKEYGDFTKKIKELKPEETVYVDGPYGGFTLDKSNNTEGYVFIAGGIGISPIISMLRTLSNKSYDKPITLIYGNRDIDSIIYRDELKELESKLDINVIYVLEKYDEEWKGEKGLITAGLLQDNLPISAKKNKTHIYVCGPVPMLKKVEKDLKSLGISSNIVHSEHFDFI